jgi:hypothetical protein
MATRTPFFLLALLAALCLLACATAFPTDDLISSAKHQIADMLSGRVDRLFQEAASSSSGILPLVEQLSDLGKIYQQHFGSNTEDQELPYFRFIPGYKNSIIPFTSPAIKWSTPCFGDVQGSVSIKNNTATITIISDKVHGILCEDYYFIANMVEFKTYTIKDKGTETISWKLEDLTPAEQYDIENNGFRVFLFPEGRIKTLEYLFKTLDLFEPLTKGPAVESKYGAMNAEFINGYTSFDFAPRTNGTIVNIDPSQISSGDFIGITRLDGLDPMIVWGQGGTTGHTAVALEINGELNICESTVTDAYWPTNGIQCAPWPRWLEQARNASFNFVHVPLSPENKAKFNVTSAVEFVNASLGLPYGYNNFLFGWLDTLEDNYPCLPPKFDVCLSSHFTQILGGIVDRIDPLLANKFFNQALNKRINNNFKRTAEITEYAQSELGLTFGELLAIPEQDSWVYEQGKSMVCDVFVCSVWKASGIFGDMTDQFQCTELTPRDVYSLNVFDPNYTRPAQCVEADPNSPFCQLGGDYTLLLPGYNTKNPYPNMGNSCPGVPPVYKQPANC